MIMRWPNKIPSNNRVQSLVQHADIMPTILEWLQLDMPNDLDGRSLVPLIEGLKEKQHKEIFLSECAWQAARGIRTERFKYIETYDAGPFTRPPAELYDLLIDPNETTNLVESLPEQAHIFQTRLHNWLKGKIGEKEDPMKYILRTEGLPFKRRIQKVLEEYGLTWDEWKRNPSRMRIDGIVKK
ncbi:hypothetical protein ACA29_07720 [Lederbergia galactosidilytica]|uniref:N-sulphoglucosamine sulphohydrolase C-terminal domain-containing protein n=2 Tax=Lederbergia galactosidilytica TaxID=217031 RepID=A0A0Q9YCN1_9BACI|nr:hypothetical protein ACA29_07720 [Lederbergia galactosidilytica]